MWQTSLDNKRLKITYPDKRITAINKGNDVRCGNTLCNHKLGEFYAATGTIKCIKCGSINVIDKPC